MGTDPSLKSKEQLITDAKVDAVYRRRILLAMQELTGLEFGEWYQLLSWITQASQSKLMVIENGKIVADVRPEPEFH